MNNTTTPGQRILNYLTKPFKSWEIDKAKREYRKNHPACVICGTLRSKSGNKIDIHHVRPVHANPEKACDPANLIGLCREHHWQIGHCGISWKTWDSNVRVTVDEIRKTFFANSRPCALDRSGREIRIDHDTNS